MPFKDKYYMVRTGNDLTDLKKWIKWAKKNYPKQKFIIKKRKIDWKDPYWKLRLEAGYEEKYEVYGSY